MLVCGRCRGDGRVWWLVFLRRTCGACDGRGAVGPHDGGFASLAQPRPVPVPSHHDPGISTGLALEADLDCVGPSCDGGGD
jgi:hypothetical protein